jgi:hypothetical protein
MNNLHAGTHNDTEKKLEIKSRILQLKPIILSLGKLGYTSGISFV